MMAELAVYAFQKIQSHQNTYTSLSVNNIQEQEKEEAVTEEKVNMEHLAKLYEDITEQYLMERVHDVSSFTRSRVLKIWNDLIRREVVSSTLFGRVAELAVDRISDKKVSVRKDAVALLTTMLDHNPYGASLDNALAQQKDIHLRVALQARRNELMHQENVAGGQDVKDPPKENENTLAIGLEQENNNVVDRQQKVEDDLVEDDVEARIEEDSIVMELTKLISQNGSVIRFMNAIEKAEPKIKVMIHSKTSSDVLEALKFFARAVNFGLNGSMDFFRRCEKYKYIFYFITHISIFYSICIN